MHHFVSGSNMIVSGGSCSGKTSLVCELLKNADSLFCTKADKILFAYKHWNDTYDVLDKLSIQIKFVNYLPNEQELREFIGEGNHTIFVCDDLFAELCKSSFAVDLFSRISHHLNVSTILILQEHNAGGGNVGRSLTRNVHYHIITRGGRNAFVLRSIGCQLGDYSRLKAAYETATEKNYGYLVISTHPAGDRQQRYKSDILPSDQACHVYI